MSQETIDKINDVLKDAYEDQINLDEEIIVEEKGNFEVNIEADYGEITFSIISGGRVTD